MEALSLAVRRFVMTRDSFLSFSENTLSMTLKAIGL
jgi:hypothetical protein